MAAIHPRLGPVFVRLAEVIRGTTPLWQPARRFTCLSGEDGGQGRHITLGGLRACDLRVLVGSVRLHRTGVDRWGATIGVRVWYPMRELAGGGAAGPAEALAADGPAGDLRVSDDVVALTDALLAADARGDQATTLIRSIRSAGGWTGDAVQPNGKDIPSGRIITIPFEVLHGSC